MTQFFSFLMSCVDTDIRYMMIVAYCVILPINLLCLGGMKIFKKWERHGASDVFDCFFSITLVQMILFSLIIFVHMLENGLWILTGNGVL